MTAAIVKFVVAWLALVAFLAVHLVAFSAALHAFSWWTGAAVVIVTFSSAFGIFLSPMWGWVLETAYPWERRGRGRLARLSVQK